LATWVLVRSIYEKERRREEKREKKREEK